LLADKVIVKSGGGTYSLPQEKAKKKPPVNTGQVE